MGDTTDKTLERVIPELNQLYAAGLPRWPLGDTMCFLDDFENRTPLAAACLTDAFHMVAEARFAICEGYRQVEHYRGKDPPNELTAVFFGQFYGADVALRLYAAGEHLASAIIEMLGIDPTRLRAANRGRGSLQAAVGKYLSSSMPQHHLSTLIGEMSRSDAWNKAIRYRHLWVHEQAPLISGLGLPYKRGKQYWRKFQDQTSHGYELTGGGGDPPEISVDELLESMRAAFCTFFETLRSVAVHYNDLVSRAAARSLAGSS